MLANFANVFYWELLQNLPAVIFFMVAVRLWSQPSDPEMVQNNSSHDQKIRHLSKIEQTFKSPRLLAIISTVCGGILSTFIIDYTEPFKVSTTTIVITHAPLLDTLTTIMLISTAGSLFAIYLGGEGKMRSWKTDILMGILVALAFGLLQSPIASVPLARRLSHMLSFIIAFPISLILLRALKKRPLPTMLFGTILVTAIMSVIIAAVDYGPFLQP